MWVYTVATLKYVQLENIEKPHPQQEANGFLKTIDPMRGLMEHKTIEKKRWMRKINSKHLFIFSQDDFCQILFYVWFCSGQTLCTIPCIYLFNSLGTGHFLFLDENCVVWTPSIRQHFCTHNQLVTPLYLQKRSNSTVTAISEYYF